MRSPTRPRALVAAWFDFLAEGQKGLAESLRRIIRQAAPDASESVKWGNLVFGVDDMLLMAIVPHKAHVHLQLFNGSQLPPGLAPLEGQGRGSRQLRFRFHQAVDEAQVTAVVLACIELARSQASERAAPDAQP
jgi:hypothetical protein